MTPGVCFLLSFLNVSLMLWGLKAAWGVVTELVELPRASAGAAALSPGDSPCLAGTGGTLRASRRHYKVWRDNKRMDGFGHNPSSLTSRATPTSCTELSLLCLCFGFPSVWFFFFFFRSLGIQNTLAFQNKRKSLLWVLPAPWPLGLLIRAPSRPRQAASETNQPHRNSQIEISSQLI